MPCALCDTMLAVDILDYKTKVPICPNCSEKASTGEIPIEVFRKKIEDYVKEHNIETGVLPT